MPRTYDCVNAICPFFETSGKVSVTCEGIAEGNHVGISFDDTQQRLFFRRKYCDKNYEGCEIYKMLLKKYE